MSPTIPFPKATPLGPPEAEEIATLEAFEHYALGQGIVLGGCLDPDGSGYHVAALRADTGERLPLGFPVSVYLANHPAEFTAALEKLLADAVAMLVPK